MTVTGVGGDRNRWWPKLAVMAGGGGRQWWPAVVAGSDGRRW